MTANLSSKNTKTFYFARVFHNVKRLNKKLNRMAAFQNLRRTTFHLFPSPSTQQAFHSTRVNERDKPIHSGESSSSSGGRRHLSSRSQTKDDEPLVATVDISNSLLPLVLSPVTRLPMTYRDVQDILSGGPIPRLTSEKDIVLRAVRSVNLTSDDILVEPFGAPQHCDFVKSVNERIPVEIVAPISFSACQNHKAFNAIPKDFQSNCMEDFPQNVCTASISPALNQVFTVKNSAIPDVHSVFFSATGGTQPDNSSSKDSPTPEQMLNAKEAAEKHVQAMFYGKQDYSGLHQNIIFENNLYGANKIHRGIKAYAFELFKLRLWTNLKNTGISMDILNVTSLEQTGVIRVHWRLNQIPQSKLFNFSLRSDFKEDTEWLEAFSYFYVGKDGLIYKHRIDRTLPDDQRETSKLTEKLQDLLNPVKPLVN